MRYLIIVVLLPALLIPSACTLVRETQPLRTATEQLLISTAADMAIEKMAIPPPGRVKTWLDVSHFEGYDKGYAVSTLRAHLLRNGVQLIPERERAELIIEARSGALSINQLNIIIGMPSVEIPVPLPGIFMLPELSLLSRARQIGIAKFALTAYDARSGAFRFEVGSIYGLAWRKRWTVAGIGSGPLGILMLNIISQQ